MSDALEQVQKFAADPWVRMRCAPWCASDEPLNHGECDCGAGALVSDLRAVCAELTALRGARSWERWAIVDERDALKTLCVRHQAAMSLRYPGERVIRVRITEIPEDGQ